MSTEFIPERALAITPHPDDAEIGAGGTLSKWMSAGTEVTLVVCTNGDKGSADPEMTSPRLTAIREKEQRASAAFLGFKEVVFLGHPDGEIDDTREFRGDLVREVRRSKPDVVLTCDPFRRTFYLHRDHRITGQVAIDAVFPYARDHLSYPEHKELGLEPHKTAKLYLWASDEPDTQVDIGDFLQVKIEALKHFKSQIAAEREAELTKYLVESATKAGEAKGMKAAEAFRVIEMRG
jgi:LmbE family N-acetylglucosaminyl deacetylase